MVIRLRLDDPAMTLLHIAGFVGLWMTLSELAKKYPTKDSRLGGLDWALCSDEICLTWHGEDFAVLDWLLNQAFQVNDQGIIDLTGDNPDLMSLEAKLARHKCLLRTFLQHYKFVSSGGQGSVAVPLNGRDIEVRYKKVKSYAHQDFAKKLCNKKGVLRTKSVGIVHWLYPGLVVRHYAFPKHTRFEESLELSFVLLFAIVACKYFKLPKSASVSKSQYALIIPEFTDLESYSETQRQAEKLRYGDFSALSLYDAGLRALTHSPEQRLSEKPQRCQAILFGEAPWSKQQSTRISVLELCIGKEALSSYKVFYGFDLQKKIFDCASERMKIAYSFIGQLITENLAKNQPWWLNLSEYSKNEESLNLIFDGREVLLYMFRKTKRNSRAEELFIQACHETLRRIYAKIYDRTQDGEFAQIERKNKQLQYRLRLCKSEDAFRGFLTAFLAEASPNSVIVNNQTELMPILTGEIDWRLTRDLFLLSMISYKKAKDLVEEDASQKSE